MKARVVSNSKIKCTYYKLTLSTPSNIDALPGQFLMIRSGAEHCPSDPLLSRPFSIHRINPDNNIEILYKVVGKGTALLTNVDEGEEIDITGPLGNGFGRVFSDETLMPLRGRKVDENPLPFKGRDRVGMGLFSGETVVSEAFTKGNENFPPLQGDGQGGDGLFSGEIIIIAGGIGIAPMVGLIEYIKARDPQRKIIVFLGGRGEEDLLCVDELKSISTELILTTNDGSVGTKGYVTNALEKYLSFRIPHSAFRISIYACGPTPMLRRISEITESLNITTFFSLESNMACGIGICMGCAVKKRGGGYFLVCKDGPVFKGETIDL